MRLNVSTGDALSAGFMKLNKAIALFGLLFVLCLSCSSSTKEDEKKQVGWTVTINGKVGFPQQGQIIIMENRPGASRWQDTITLKSNYTFSKKVKLTEPGFYRINFYNRQTVDVILSQHNLEVNVDGNDPQGFWEVKGSRDLDLVRKLASMVQKTDTSPEMARINAEFTKARETNNEAKMIEMQNAYMQLTGKTHEDMASLLRNEPPSLGAVYYLQLQSNPLDKDKYFTTYVTVADKAMKAWPQSAYVNQFASMVDVMKKTAVGQPAPEIALPDTNGNIVKLSSMRGKYVLVDFWAKWCGPCRQENPNVVRVFNKYKNKGFTVFGVSLDRTKQDWLAAIAEDGLTWTHVSDLKYWQSEAAKTYNITGIPFSILLDPNGVIIAKNLRGRALENKLAEVFAEKSK